MAVAAVDHRQVDQACSPFDQVDWRFVIFPLGPLHPVPECSSEQVSRSLQKPLTEDKRELTSIRFMSCPKSAGLIVAEDAEVEVPPLGPLDPGGDGGKEGTGTRLILELATD